MGIHEFSNWLNEMQIKLIDKHGKQSIKSLKLQIKDDWTYERIVEAAEGYEAAHKKHRNTITTRQGSKQVSHPVHHDTTPPQIKTLDKDQQTTTRARIQTRIPSIKH